jgi:hypothetical protein
LGAASAVRPCIRLVSGTGGTDAGGTGAGGAAGAAEASAEAADCNASGTAEGVAAKFSTMPRQGTPGLAAGSAVAVAHNTRTGHIRPTVATAAKAGRFVGLDMVFPDFVDGTATDRSFTALMKLLKRKL